LNPHPDPDCQTCGGRGIVIEQVRVDMVPGCCHRFLSSGECCGNAIPLPEPVYDERDCECVTYENPITIEGENA